MVRTSVELWVKADEAVFLASADSNAMTGQCMHLVSLPSYIMYVGY